MMLIKEVYILLGSNRGDRLDYLTSALRMISIQAGLIVRKSAVYESAPWGFDDSTNFLNQVVEIETKLPPEELLEQLLTIESRLGRIRPFNACGCSIPSGLDGFSDQNPGSRHSDNLYASRTIDLDILFYGDRLVFTDNLMIPHPRLHERRFTLVPLNEIAPGLVHPLLKKKISTLLGECRDQAKIIALG